MPRLGVTITESSKDGPVPCRVQVSDGRGEVYSPDGCPQFCAGSDAYFNTDGNFEIEVPEGEVSLRAARGTEYTPVLQRIKVPEKGASAQVELSRWSHLREQGWQAADFHVHHTDRLEEHLAAEDLTLAHVIWSRITTEHSSLQPFERTVVPARPGSFYTLGQEVERSSRWGISEPVFFLGLDKPVSIPETDAAYPMNSVYCESARFGGGIVGYQGPIYNQLPIDLSRNLVDFVCIADNYFSISQDFFYEFLGQFEEEYQGPFAKARWIFDSYYRLLNCGFILPPAAGSSSPLNDCGPVGYNRVYIKTLEDPGFESLMAGLKSGRCFVTNGPVITMVVDECEMGSTIPLMGTGPDELPVRVEVRSAVPLDLVELIANGKVIESYEPRSTEREIQWETVVEVRRSQWLAARCLGRVDSAAAGWLHCPPFFFAHSGPTYLLRKKKPVIVGRSVSRILKNLDRMSRWCEQPDLFSKNSRRAECRTILDEARSYYLALLDRE